jgi:hypothetical protein
MLIGVVDAKITVDNMTMQAGVDELETTPLYQPINQLILIGLGLLFFVGVAAFIRCGGATLCGYTIGRPATAAAGFLGMVGVVGAIIVFMTGLSFYIWYVK